MDIIALVYYIVLKIIDLRFIDINECLNNNGGCTHTCVNKPGSYECQCNEGFYTNDSGRNCLGNIVTNIINVITHYIDINECLTNNGGCEQLCNNTYGSFICYCSSGYNLGQGIFCSGIFLYWYHCKIIIDINECQNDNGKCDQICVNEIGSYHCDCRTGYKLDNNGLNCQSKFN